MVMDIGTDGLTLGLAVSALLFGLRHGIDWDHIAAITDIAATQDSPRRGIRLGTVYVIGHALVVLLLGLGVITIGRSIPEGMDQAMGRVVGWTLLIMGVYVIVTLLRDRGEFRMRSRWMLLFAGVRRVRRFFASIRPTTVTHEHLHASSGTVHHDGGASVPDAKVGTRLRAPTHRHAHSHDLGEDEYGTAAVAGIGMLHGIGAETPTQLVIFLAAANAGGFTTGIAVLVVFIAGLVISNSVITVMSALSFTATSNSGLLYRALGATTAVMSIVVGGLFIFGADGTLPAFFAG